MIRIPNCWEAGMIEAPAIVVEILKEARVPPGVEAQKNKMLKP